MLDCRTGRAVGACAEPADKEDASQVKEKHEHFGGNENLEGASNVVVTKARSVYMIVVKDPVRDDSVYINI